jgi:septation ring formation regulator EzrA
LDDCKQAEVCEQKFANLEEKIEAFNKLTDEKIRVANHRIEDVEIECKKIGDVQNVLSELKVLVGLQREDGLKRDKMIQEFNHSQFKITQTLDCLANKLAKTDDNVEKIAEEVSQMEEKISDLKQDNVNQMKENSISIPTLVKYFIAGGIGAILTVFIERIVSTAL